MCLNLKSDTNETVNDVAVTRARVYKLLNGPRAIS